MSDTREIKVPDIGDFQDVEVIEVHVSAGDEVGVEDPLITLESDKATMDVPSPAAGRVESVTVKVGDKVSEGSPIMALATSDAKSADAAPETEGAAEKAGEGDGDGGGNSGQKQASAGDAPRARSSSAGGKADVQAEVVVLGSGPGGYTAAFRAADLGKRTVLVERYPTLGGVCLNVGCIPSKALLHAAKVISETKEMAEHGVTFGKPSIEVDKLRGWKDSVVGQLTKGLSGLASKRKVQVVQGTGRFDSPNRMSVETNDGTVSIDFEHAIIAAGSESARIPGLPEDDPRVMTSTGALEIEEIPKRLLVVGGGIIGLEMATVYHELGASVSVVELMDSLMPGTDPDIVKPLANRVRKQYENIWLQTKVAGVEAKQDWLQVHLDGPGGGLSERFDRVLVAVGRTPNGRSIGAENAGVQVDGPGFIKVDNQQRTNVAHIFAIGDIVGQPMLAHKATHEGKVAAEVAAGHKSGFDARVIPSVAYTDPEVAWAGVTEAQAKEKGIKYGKGTFPWAASGRSLGLGRSEGITKLLFDPDTERVIGAGIVGPSAGDLIAEVALAIEMGCDARDIGLTIHPHPTLSETVAFAAEMFEGTITDLYAPRR